MRPARLRTPGPARVLRVLLLPLVLAGALAARPAADQNGLAELGARAQAELTGNILPFWLEEVPHPDRGGFYGEVVERGRPRPEAARACLMTSRILWTFSAAYRATSDERYRSMADRAYQDLITTFHDPEFGGYYWSVDARGRPQATVKHVYGQVFVLYGLAEYHRATGAEQALERAVALYRLIEAQARDHEHGGYFEAFDREWRRQPPDQPTVIGPAESKSQNTHLHIMEAYANLLRVWPDEGLRRAQRQLIELILDRIVNPETLHLGLYFADDWAPRSDEVSYGHDIEFAWLVTEAVDELGDAALRKRVRPLAVRIAEVTLAEGVAPDGGIPYEAAADGTVTEAHREWWVPAEAAVGFLNAYQISGEQRFLDAALGQWRFIEEHFVDAENGEWHHSLSPEGGVLPGGSKASGWKCPYHNGRACLELAKRVRQLTAGG